MKIKSRDYLTYLKYWIESYSTRRKLKKIRREMENESLEESVSSTNLVSLTRKRQSVLEYDLTCIRAKYFGI